MSYPPHTIYSIWMLVQGGCDFGWAVGVTLQYMWSNYYEYNVHMEV